MSTTEVVVAGWPPPKGYSNGRTGRGTPLHTGGQIGWDPQGRFPPGGLVPQFGKALENIVAVVAAAGGQPADIATMTVYVTDIDAYRTSQKELGAAWRQHMGKHFPAMALVAVTALVEREAVVEIQAVAYVEA